jgi:hypothetical protein
MDMGGFECSIGLHVACAKTNISMSHFMSLSALQNLKTALHFNPTVLIYHFALGQNIRQTQHLGIQHFASRSHRLRFLETTKPAVDRYSVTRRFDVIFPF